MTRQSRVGPTQRQSERHKLIACVTTSPPSGKEEVKHTANLPMTCEPGSAALELSLCGMCRSWMSSLTTSWSQHRKWKQQAQV